MIDVTKEPDMGPPMENCCFCRKKTKYWFVPKDVACCITCAQQAEVEDVPDKKTWMRRERIAVGPIFFDCG